MKYKVFLHNIQGSSYSKLHLVIAQSHLPQLPFWSIMLQSYRTPMVAQKCVTPASDYVLILAIPTVFLSRKLFLIHHMIPTVYRSALDSATETQAYLYRLCVCNKHIPKNTAVMEGINCFLQRLKKKLYPTLLSSLPNTESMLNKYLSKERNLILDMINLVG